MLPYVSLIMYIYGGIVYNSKSLSGPWVVDRSGGNYGTSIMWVHALIMALVWVKVYAWEGVEILYFAVGKEDRVASFKDPRSSIWYVVNDVEWIEKYSLPLEDQNELWK